MGSVLGLRFALLCSNGRRAIPATLCKTTQSLGSFCSVFGAPLLAVLHALRIEHTTQDVVAHAGQIFYAAAADHHHRMLLQIVALARDVADDLEPVGEPHLRDLTQGGVRLLRRRGVDACADAALLRALLQRRHLLLCVLRHARLADQLIDGRHRLACNPSLYPPASQEMKRWLNSNAQNGRAPSASNACGAHPFHRGPRRANAKRSCTSHLTVVRGSV